MWTKVQGSFQFRDGTPVEFNVYKNKDGGLFTNQSCHRCGGAGVFKHPAFRQYEAGGVAGGCFSCAATGYHTVKAYSAS
jgi:hypothetical protein|tara:strand:- start:340 stop:576 length:237 start_codon:yes stop_codon:yes gene_type:complete